MPDDQVPFGDPFGPTGGQGGAGGPGGLSGRGSRGGRRGPNTDGPGDPARALEELAGGLRSCPAAIEAALWASQFVASARDTLEVPPMASRAERKAAEHELEQMLLALVELAAESISPTALCLVAALSDAAPPVVRSEAAAVRDDKLRRRTPGPAWVAHCGKAELLAVHQWVDRFGDGQSVILQFTYPDGDEHCLNAYIDHNMGGLLKQLFATGPLQEIQEVAAAAPTPMELRPLDPAEAAGWLRSGTWVLDHMPGAPVDDDVPASRALLEARLELLPHRDEPTRAQPDHDAIDATVRSFVSAPEAAEAVASFSADEVEAVAGLAAHHAAAYCGGIADRVSPTTMELFLVDHLPRKVMDADELMDSVGPVLQAWAQWCGRRRDLDDGQITEVIDSIEFFVPQFVDLIGSGGDRAGRAGTALRVLQWAQQQGLIGDDNDDLASMQAAMSLALARFNELSFEERGAILGLEEAPGTTFSDDWDDEGDGDGWPDDDDDGHGAPEFPWPDRRVLGVGVMLAPMPPTRSDEVGASAADAPVLAQFATMQRYFGGGRPLTQKGNVKLADARELIDLLDTGDQAEWRSGDRDMKLRSVEDAPVLSRRLALAQACGALGPAGRTLRLLGTSDAWEQPTQDQALENLTRIVDTALEVGLYTLGFRVEGSAMHDRFTDHMNAIAPMSLFALAARAGDDGPSSFESLTDLFLGITADGLPWRQDVSSPWARESAERDVERVVENLEWLGIVSWVGSDEVPERWTGQPRRRGGRVPLTPAGVEVLRQVLPTFGVTFDAASPF